MNKLDSLVRMSLLRYPTLYATRWDVLRNLYLGFGHGYEWIDGELSNIFKEDDEETARSRFFRDINEDAAEHQAAVDRGIPDFLQDLYERRRVNLELRRQRRRFQFDNLDMITVEDRLYLTGSWDNPHGIVRTISTRYSPIFLVPDNAEESFRRGAREVFDIAIPMLYDLELCGHDHGMRATLIASQNRIFPPSPYATELAKKLIDEIRREEEEEEEEEEEGE
ncbi:hypothetical protein [Inquilinus limosus]|uniref:Uncharacterized protein n=1 Tax=Inquilinus limosus MP06 TaxID=1398085 RepID=A0A0A0DE46_9PROT|nr:hypothetical protein [Inquilinus limosus]KGM36173.1 hypothetical protein P409_00565 [Inquilinus limosus MP06]